MPEGNGDPELVLFEEDNTQSPCSGKRNLFCSIILREREVSADGHNWTMSLCHRLSEKNWPTSYGSREDFREGQREIANNRDGHLWDFCKRKGISYRSYGEFIDGTGLPSRFWRVISAQPSPCQDASVRDTVRFNQWRRDFDSLLAINAVPQFNTIRFINDHTEGLSLGKPTPLAHVADNGHSYRPVCGLSQP